MWIALADPDTVTIRSGHDPSDMLIFAPDYEKKREKFNEKIEKTAIKQVDLNIQWKLMEIGEMGKQTSGQKEN